MSPGRYFTFVHVRQRLGLWDMESPALGRMLDRWGKIRGLSEEWGSYPKTFPNPSVDCPQTNRKYPWALLDDCCDWVRQELATELEFQRMQGDLFT